MLVKLLPNQISEQWRYIREAIIESMPPHIRLKVEQLGRILQSLLQDDMQCWYMVDKEDQPLAILTTAIFEDQIIGEKCLRIYSLFGFDTLPLEEWKEGYETLYQYAKGNGCDFIDAFTVLSHIEKIAVMFGSPSMMRYIRLEVNHG